MNGLTNWYLSQQPMRQFITNLLLSIRSTTYRMGMDRTTKQRYERILQSYEALAHGLQQQRAEQKFHFSYITYAAVNSAELVEMTKWAFQSDALLQLSFAQRCEFDEAYIRLKIDKYIFSMQQNDKTAWNYLLSAIAALCQLQRIVHHALMTPPSELGVSSLDKEFIQWKKLKPKNS